MREIEKHCKVWKLFEMHVVVVETTGLCDDNEAQAGKPGIRNSARILPEFL